MEEKIITIAESTDVKIQLQKVDFATWNVVKTFKAGANWPVNHSISFTLTEQQILDIYEKTSSY